MNLAIGNDDKTVAVPTEDERKNYLEDISSGRESFESLSSHIVILTKKIEEKVIMKFTLR